MASSKELQIWVNMVISKAYNLPKTDALGSIDPYIKVKLPGKQEAAPTPVIVDNPNPIWSAPRKFFILYNPYSESNELATITFQLWDKNNRLKDEKVGKAKLKLTKEDLAGFKKVTIPFELKKYKNNATLMIELDNYYSSMQALYFMSQETIPDCSFTSNRFEFLLPGYNSFKVQMENREENLFVKLIPSDRSINVDVTLDNQLTTVTYKSKGPNTTEYDELSFEVPYKLAKSVRFNMYRRELVEKKNLGEVFMDYGYEPHFTGWVKFRNSVEKFPTVEKDDERYKCKLHYPLDSENYVKLELDAGESPCMYAAESPNFNFFYEVDVTLDPQKLPVNGVTKMVLVDNRKECKDVRLVKAKQMVRISGIIKIGDLKLYGNMKAFHCSKYAITMEKQFHLGDVVKLQPF